jgi:hypothetical protein
MQHAALSVRCEKSELLPGTVNVQPGVRGGVPIRKRRDAPEVAKVVWRLHTCSHNVGQLRLLASSSSIDLVVNANSFRRNFFEA